MKYRLKTQNLKLKFLLVILLFALHFTLFASSVNAQQATLSLTPSSGTFNRSCNFTLDIRLDTGGIQTDGTDAILIYDPTRVGATSITSGSIYTDYPGNNICENENLCSGIGRITVSGLASISTAFSGQGSLATVNFKVKDNAPTGVTQIKFDFDPSDKGKTTDSNVVQRGGTATDSLNSVVNGNYTIGTGTCGTLPATGTGGPGQGSVSTPSAEETQVPVKALPPAGTEQLTFTLAIVGSILVVLGILGMVLL